MVFLEIEPRLEFYYTSSQRILRAPEVRVIDCRREEAKRREIQVVKDVEEVCFNFQIRSFTEKCRHAGSLTEAHVNRKILWTTEGITTDARRRIPPWIVEREEVLAPAGKVSEGSDEGFVTGVVQRASLVTDRPRWTDEILRIS
jgi:hypothetical protein